MEKRKGHDFELRNDEPNKGSLGTSCVKESRRELPLDDTRWTHPRFFTDTPQILILTTIQLRSVL